MKTSVFAMMSLTLLVSTYARAEMTPQRNGGANVGSGSLPAHEEPASVPGAVKAALDRSTGIPITAQVFSPPDKVWPGEVKYPSRLQVAHNKKAVFLRPALTAPITSSYLKYRYNDHRVRPFPVIRIDSGFADVARLFRAASNIQFNCSTETDGTPLSLSFEFPHEIAFDTDYRAVGSASGLVVLKDYRRIQKQKLTFANRFSSSKAILQIDSGDGFKGQMAIRQKYLIGVVDTKGYSHLIGQTRSFKIAAEAIARLSSAKQAALAGDLSKAFGLDRYDPFN